MSTVVIAWVPEGIAVSSDTRATGEKGNEFILDNDYSIKTLPFKEYKMAVTLCGDSYFGDIKFENFIQELIDRYSSEHFKLGNFVCDLLGEILNNTECIMSQYEIVVAGYDVTTNRQTVAVIKKEEGNSISGKDDWFITELNGLRETEAQLEMFPDLVEDEGQYGMYVAGVDVDNINSVFNNEYERQKMHERFSKISLNEAAQICEQHLKNTIKHLDANNNYSVTGGATVNYTIPKEGM